MQLFPTLGDDPLDAAALARKPDKSELERRAIERKRREARRKRREAERNGQTAPDDETGSNDDTELKCHEPELNYRTRPMSSENELRLTFLVMFAPILILLPLMTLLNGLIGLHFFFEKLVLAGSLLLGLRIVFRQVIGKMIRTELTLICILGAAFIFGRLWTWMDGAMWCRTGLLLAWLCSCSIARQVAAWILVGPKVDLETMTHWQANMPEILRLKNSLACPELLTFALSPLLLGPAWWLAAWSTTKLGCFWLWPLGLILSLHAGWFLLHLATILFVPWPNWEATWRATFQALVVFITYDAHQTPAAGVFRFPTRWMRPPQARWMLIVCVVMALALGCASSWPDPVEQFRRGRSFTGQLVVNLTLVTVEAPVVFATVLWFTAGALLACFDKKLSTHSCDGASDWDHYVERIINSKDDLEAEHLLWGTSMVGDYPILVHSEIYNQHVHLLGDSGASKTSLAIAPHATQLIARGDDSVVIVDLKGDKALFQACRLEAERAGLRFRWMANEVGLTSHVFNPFLQSHNDRLSLEQFVQEILQGLSLDHGIAYGKGYYTAMNEIVMRTVLKNYRVRSFRELDRYLRSQRLYSKIGHAEDWAQSRHLGSLVSKLAATEAINVVPGMFPEQPAIQSDAIDAANVFAEPQVVYLWLRSAVESSNAPAIARLFLWAMFNAASHREQNGQRVYFFLDEFQQVLSDGIKLIFEQFRDLGGTIIAAHQTAGQLRRQDSDLGQTVDSCTAVKQVFRASDLESLERLEKLAGSRLSKFANWVQPYDNSSGTILERFDPYHAEEGLVNVRQMESPLLSCRQLMEISSQKLASLVRFTFASGYTQFAGATVPIVSQYPISFKEYDARRQLPWPTAPGAFVVPRTPLLNSTSNREASGKHPRDQFRDDDFVKDFERRGRSSHSGRRRT